MSVGGVARLHVPHPVRTLFPFAAGSETEMSTNGERRPGCSWVDGLRLDSTGSPPGEGACALSRPLMIAEDVQQNPMVTLPTAGGGLGFDLQGAAGLAHPEDWFEDQRLLAWDERIAWHVGVPVAGIWSPVLDSTGSRRLGRAACRASRRCAETDRSHRSPTRER